MGEEWRMYEKGAKHRQLEYQRPLQTTQRRNGEGWNYSRRVETEGYVERDFERIKNNKKTDGK